MALTLLQIFPSPRDLLALGPEELAGVLVEVIPAVLQNGGFQLASLTAQVQSIHVGEGYGHDAVVKTEFALAEALSWLEVQGLIMRIAGDSRIYYLTRRGQTLRTKVDVDTYRLGRSLPIELLQPYLAEKVHHLFLRGDHDLAVQQAFKEVEVSVRAVSGLGDEKVGRDLMKAAFHVDKGPLRDKDRIPAEREAELMLFVGAYGHARNPVVHREVNLSREDAARLIVFASYLLDVVTSRWIKS